MALTFSYTQDANAQHTAVTFYIDLRYFRQFEF